MSAVVRKTRAVTTRDASRQLSQLLDEIERDDMAILIVRYGRPAAMIIPFEETAEAITLPRIADLSVTSSVEEGTDVDDVEVDPLQERVLRDMALCTDRFWHVDRMSREGPLSPLLAAVTRLELSGLVDREWHGGLNLTRKGRRVAARLDSEA